MLSLSGSCYESMVLCGMSHCSSESYKQHLQLSCLSACLNGINIVLCGMSHYSGKSYSHNYQLSVLVVCLSVCCLPSNHLGMVRCVMYHCTYESHITEQLAVWLSVILYSFQWYGAHITGEQSGFNPRSQQPEMALGTIVCK